MYLVRVLVDQVQRVARELHAASLPALHEEGILLAYIIPLSVVPTAYSVPGSRPIDGARRTGDLPNQIRGHVGVFGRHFGGSWIYWLSWSNFCNWGLERTTCAPRVPPDSHGSAGAGGCAGLAHTTPHGAVSPLRRRYKSHSLSLLHPHARCLIPPLQRAQQHLVISLISTLPGEAVVNSPLRSPQRCFRYSSSQHGLLLLLHYVLLPRRCNKYVFPTLAFENAHSRNKDLQHQSYTSLAPFGCPLRHQSPI